MIGKPRRNPLAQKTLSRYATDHERCKRDGHQRFSGTAGGQNAGNLYISLHARFQLVRLSMPTRRAAATADPDDSQRLCSTNKLTEIRRTAMLNGFVVTSPCPASGTSSLLMKSSWMGARFRTGVPTSSLTSKDGYAWNLSILNQSSVTGLEFEHRIVAFHEVFTLPREFLESLLAARGRDRPRLLAPYREHLSQAFARDFMRVGLPVPVDVAWELPLEWILDTEVVSGLS
jgi:hypothetical protein